MLSQEKRDEYRRLLSPGAYVVMDDRGVNGDFKIIDDKVFLEANGKTAVIYDSLSSLSHEAIENTFAMECTRAAEELK